MEISKDGAAETDAMNKVNDEQDKDLMVKLTNSIIGKVIKFAIDIVES